MERQEAKVRLKTVETIFEMKDRKTRMKENQPVVL
jgi:hypothetical protein